MKKLAFPLLLLFIAFTFTQCTNNVDEEIKAIDVELMEGHDTVMPKSMGLIKLKDNVLAKAAEGDSTMKNQATTIANNLQTAEDNMYKWMDDYSAAMNDEQDKEKKLEMYHKLKVDIDRISTDTDNAIKAAKDFAATNKTNSEE
jgi:hypothetical protein